MKGLNRNALTLSLIIAMGPAALVSHSAEASVIGAIKKLFKPSGDVEPKAAIDPKEDLDPKSFGKTDKDGAQVAADGIRRVYLADESILDEVGAIKYTRDYLAGKSPYVGREEILDTVMKRTFGLDKPHVMILGEAGAGKTTMVRQVARLRFKKYDEQIQLFKQGRLDPGVIEMPRFVEVDINNLVAGTTYRGDLEARMKALLEFLDKEAGRMVPALDEAGVELLDKNGEKILVKQTVYFYMDEVHQIMGAGKGSQDSGGLDQMFKRFLTDSNVRVIASTTTNEFSHIAKDAAVERRFGAPVRIPSPSTEEAVDIVVGSLPRYENYYGIKIPREMVRMIVKLGETYRSNLSMPDPALDLVNRLGSKYLDQVHTGLRPRTPLGALDEKLKSLQKDLREAVLKTDALDLVAREKNEDLSREIKRIQEEIERFSASAASHQSSPVVTLDDLMEVAGKEYDNISPAVLRRSFNPNAIELNQLLRTDFPNAVPSQRQAAEQIGAKLFKGMLRLSAREGRPKASVIVLGDNNFQNLAKALDELVFGANNDKLIREARQKTLIIDLDPKKFASLDRNALLQQVRGARPRAIAFQNLDLSDKDTVGVLAEIVKTGELKYGNSINPTRISLEQTAILIHLKQNPEDLLAIDRSLRNSGGDELGHEALAQWLTRNETSIEELGQAHPIVELFESVDGFVALSEASLKGLARLAKQKVKDLTETIDILKQMGLKLSMTNSAQVAVAARSGSVERLDAVLDSSLMDPLSELLARNILKNGDEVELGFSRARGQGQNVSGNAIEGSFFVTIRSGGAANAKPRIYRILSSGQVEELK